MKAYFAFALSSCFLAAVLAQMSPPPPCIEQEECPEGMCCAGYPPFGGICKNLTIEGEKCQVVPKTVPIFGDFYIGVCPCEEGLVCAQQGKKKNKGICQLPPTTAAPTEAPVDDSSDSGASDDTASAEAAPAEAAAPAAAPAEE